MKLARVIFDGVGLVATFCCGAMLLAAGEPPILTPPSPPPHRGSTVPACLAYAPVHRFCIRSRPPASADAI